MVALSSRHRCAATTLRLARGVLLLLACAASLAGAQQAIVVSPGGPVPTIAAAIARAPRGGTIVVRAGTYREPTIDVNKPVIIAGDRGAVLDGEGKRQIMTIS